MRPTENQISELLRAVPPAADRLTDGYSELEETATASPRCAAVLVPLLAQGEEWHVLFTRRTTRVESHKGQVSFPGGACDPGEETSEATALREAQEELGIATADVRILGRLSPLQTVSHYRVTPVVGAIPWPYVFHVANAEVARVFTMPLGWLADHSNRWEMPIPGRQRRVYFYHPYESELLWGATAQITVDLVDSLGVGR